MAGGTTTLRTMKIIAGARPWLLLSIWPLGYFLTYSTLPGFALQYGALSLLALFSCGLLLFGLRKPLAHSLPVWMFLLVFVFGYYLEFYLILFDPSILDVFFAPTKMTQIDTDAFFTCYLAMTGAFVGTNLVSLFYLQSRSRQPDVFAGPYHNNANDRILWQLSLSFGAIVLASSLLAYRFNLIGSSDRDLLPLHLEGIIDYFRVVTAPLLAVFTIQLASLDKRRNWITAGVITLLAFALSDMVLRTSKGTFISMAFALIFLRLIADKKPSKKQVTTGLILLVIGLLLFPVFLVFRILRAQGMEIDAGLSSSIRQLLDLGTMPAALTYLYRLLVLRFTGAGALLAITTRHIHPLGIASWDAFWGPRSWSGYINMEVFGVSPRYVDYFGIAPSLVGLFYVLGGVAAAAIGCTSLWALILFGWNQLGRLGVALGPASRAIYLEMVLWVVVDGNATLQLAKELGVFTVSLLAAYWLSNLDLLDLLASSRTASSGSPRPASVGG
jgi:hypothetical protein